MAGNIQRLRIIFSGQSALPSLSIYHQCAAQFVEKILHFQPYCCQNFSSKDTNFSNFPFRTHHFSSKICSLDSTFGNLCGTHPPKKSWVRPCERHVNVYLKPIHFMDNDVIAFQKSFHITPLRADADDCFGYTHRKRPRKMVCDQFLIISSNRLRMYLYLCDKTMWKWTVCYRETNAKYWVVLILISFSVCWFFSTLICFYPYFKNLFQKKKKK